MSAGRVRVGGVATDWGMIATHLISFTVFFQDKVMFRIYYKCMCYCGHF